MLWKKKKIRKKVRTTEVNKIVTVVLKKDDISYADEAYQWNYGQILRIQGGNLPKVVEVHFSLEETSGTSVTRIGTTVDGVTEVPIPDSYLENNNCSQDYTIYAYIYLEDGTAGRTEHEIAIPVKARTKPEVPGTPEEPELFRETVKAVNDAADRAEQAEQNAKASATEAGKYAASASESAATAEKTKEDALKEVGEKKQEAIEAIQEQEETSVGKITTHADDEIQRIQNQTAGSKRELEQTITNAGVSKKELEYSIETAGTSKTELDKSTELAGTAKTELDTSTQKAGEAKTALDESARTAGEMQETLSATVKQAGALDTSLGEKIENGTQLKTDLTASGEKAVQDIQNAGSEQLGKMQAVAEAFTADREQITTNKEDIGSLKEDLSDKITKFYASNQGETHLADSDNGKIMDMMLYGKSSQDGTPTPDNPVEIKSVVNPTVKVTNEDETESQTVTLPYTLNAIPVSSGGNVTIGEQQYISDYVDIEKGKLYRKVKRLNLKDVADIKISHGFHSNGSAFLSVSVGNTNKEHRPISNRYKSSNWTNEIGYVYTPNGNDIVLVDDRFTDKQTAIKLVQDTYVIYALSSQTEEDLSLKQIKSLKSLSTNYPVTNITVGSEELNGYAVFNYPVSMSNGWNYVKQQLNDNRDYIYDMNLQSAEAYVNSEYAVALTELEV